MRKIREKHIKRKSSRGKKKQKFVARGKNHQTTVLNHTAELITF